MELRATHAFVALPIPLLAATALVAAEGPLPAWLGPSMVALGVAGVAWAAAVALAPRLEAGRGTLLWIVAGAVLLRLVVLAGEVGTSDDLHRYAWEIRRDGELVLPGFDVTEVDAEGRVLRVLGFFGPLPEDD